MFFIILFTQIITNRYDNETPTVFNTTVVLLGSIYTFGLIILYVIYRVIFTKYANLFILFNNTVTKNQIFRNFEINVIFLNF